MMKSKLVTSMLALLFTSVMASAAHAGEACCEAAAAGDKAAGEAVAPCQHAEAAGCADCGAKCDCPDCAASKGCAEGKCEKCEHCANAAKGEMCANCPGPDKCPHHENCQAGCGCAPSSDGSGTKPEGGEGK